eukprot:5514867-Pleurochrysis_carterae.AAC.1
MAGASADEVAVLSRATAVGIGTEATTELPSVFFVGTDATGAAEAKTRARRKFKSGGYAAAWAEDHPDVSFCPPAIETWVLCSQ